MITILIVEDDEFISSVFKSMLERADLGTTNTTICGNHLEALGSISANDPYDVVITDLDLPGKNQGALVAKAAKEKNADTYVIAMSGGVVDPNLADIGNPDIFIAKPFVLEEMLGTIKRALASRA